MNEADPIARARNGDEAAWATLVRHHQEPVFRLAYLLLGDADEAEDIAQETFIRAFRFLDRFDAARPLRPWLLQITSNLARNRQRSLRRYLAALRRWVDSRPQTTELNAIPHQDDVRLLWRAVQRLSTTDQEVIYLRYFLDLSVAEAAATLDIAPGTVKSRLSRARDRLRGVVEREFPELREERAP